MWTISMQTRYALHTLYSLAASYGKGPKLVSELALEGGVPIFFLQKTLFALKRDGIVASKVGRTGGYELGQPPESITLGSVIRSLEGTLAPVRCAGDAVELTCEECADRLTCGTRLVMLKVRDATAGILDRITLADVVATAVAGGLVAGCSYGEDTPG